MNNKVRISAIIILVTFTCFQCRSNKNPTEPRKFVGDIEHLLIDPPDHGYVTNMPASKWEEAMITGNGTFGALVMGLSS